MGVCVEPFGVPMSLGEPFEQFIYRSAAEREGRQRAHSVRRLLGHGVQCPGRRRGLGDVRARHAVRAAAIPRDVPARHAGWASDVAASAEERPGVRSLAAQSVDRTGVGWLRGIAVPWSDAGPRLRAQSRSQPDPARRRQRPRQCRLPAPSATSPGRNSYVHRCTRATHSRGRNQRACPRTRCFATSGRADTRSVALPRGRLETLQSDSSPAIIRMTDSHSRQHSRGATAPSGWDARGSMPSLLRRTNWRRVCCTWGQVGRPGDSLAARGQPASSDRCAGTRINDVV
jgi:hypothetical protein